MTEEFQRLRKTIQKERDCGIVTCHIEQCIRDTPALQKDELNVFIQRLGFSPIHPWKEIHRGQAKAIAQMILSQDVAYHSKIMSLFRAEELAKRFLHLFPEPTTYRTNAVFETHSGSATEQPYINLSSWTPITASTFDTGVVCVNAQHIGILWVQDED